MEHSTEILYNKTEVYCSTVHRFGSDALLLARFCEPRRSQKAADLCHNRTLLYLPVLSIYEEICPCTALADPSEIVSLTAF